MFSSCGPDLHTYPTPKFAYSPSHLTIATFFNNNALIKYPIFMDQLFAYNNICLTLSFRILSTNMYFNNGKVPYIIASGYVIVSVNALLCKLKFGIVTSQIA